MNQEMMNTAMLVCTSVSFLTALIAGGFAAAAANAWLKNRREARTAQILRAERRNEQERMTWSAMLADRDERIASLEAEISRMKTLGEIADRLLAESEERRILLHGREYKVNDAGKVERA